LYQQKETTMKQEMTYNRTTLNGTEWQIIADNFGAALYMHNFGKEGFHYSGYYFRSVAEAQAYLDKVDERVSNPVEFRPVEIPADYYGVRGRYYGD